MAMKKLLWGVALIVIGLGLALRAFGVIDFDIFFTGCSVFGGADIL